MTGLFLKDIITIKHEMKPFYFLFYILPLLICIQNKEFFMIIFSTLVPFAFISMFMMILNSDESSKWRKNSVSLPLSVKKIVFSKYIFGLSMSLFSGIIIFLVGALLGSILSINYHVIIIFSFFSAGILELYISILLPLVYRFGIESSRYVFFVLLCFPIIILNILSLFNIDLFIYINQSSISQIITICLLLLIFILSFTYKLSCEWY